MEEHKLKSGNILRVIQDITPESPNTWRNEDIFLVYNHRQFNVERKGFEPRAIFAYLNADKDDPENSEDYSNYFIFPVDAYIHSGIHLSLANTTNYPDRRSDVSTTGYILVKKDSLDTIEEEGEIKIRNPRDLAEGLIKTWNQYLSGDIYGFQVLKPVKTYTITEKELENITSYDISPGGIPSIYLDDLIEKAQESIEYEELDSCWGFYGDNPKENGMLENINDELL